MDKFARNLLKRELQNINTQVLFTQEIGQSMDGQIHNWF